MDDDEDDDYEYASDEEVSHLCHEARLRLREDMGRLSMVTAIVEKGIQARAGNTPDDDANLLKLLSGRRHISELVAMAGNIERILEGNLAIPGELSDAKAAFDLRIKKLFEEFGIEDRGE